MEDDNGQPVPLSSLIERLGSHDWRVIAATVESLVQAGEEGKAAVMEGLHHPNPRVRRGCADFFDHNGGEDCIAPLRRLALEDPVPSVRRVAVHALSCQRCKPVPLQEDLIDFLTRVALTDPSTRVREEAVSALSVRPSDPRAIAALETLLRDDRNPRLVKSAHLALRLQDPGYRKAVNERARQEGIERARAAVNTG